MIKWIILLVIIFLACCIIDTIWEKEKKEYRNMERFNLLNKEEQKKRWEALGRRPTPGGRDDR